MINLHQKASRSAERLALSHEAMLAKKRIERRRAANPS